ncbi:MAG TPA: hypothetical protein PKL53_00595 [Methylotenera sp.]|nr:hypothetical protein [Methylotenera sp.]HPV44570.1 hypothetical protein [Methylotenera sp.]
MEQNQQWNENLKLIALFQVLEVSLKLYIGANYLYINEKVRKEIVFKYSFADLQNVPLGRLLKIFAKFNHNSELQKKLNNIIERRNLVAHRSMILSSESMPINLKKLTVGYGENPIDYVELNKELLECQTMLRAENLRLATLLEEIGL